MTRLSIGFRLAIWYSAVLAAGLVLFGAAMWLALQHRLFEGIDSELAQRVRGLKTVLELEDDSDRRQIRIELSEFAEEVENGGLMKLADSEGELLIANQPELFAHLDSRQPGYRAMDRDGKSFRVLADRIEHNGKSYEVMVALPLEQARSLLRDFRNALVLMIPALLAIACVGGSWLSRRALAPVDEITQTARSIHVHNLSQRLKLPRTGDQLERMSEAWNELLERLETSVKRIRQFTADASHELRTPVALIRATAELALRRERSPEHYRAALREIQQEAEQMTELTESLLSLARADSGGLEMPLATVDLTQLVEEVVKQNEPLAEAKRIRLIARLPARSASVAANEAGLRRILLILIDNALKYTPPEGKIVISASARDGGVEISVEDSGEGIGQDVLPHIFERFYRADPSRTRHAGAGLGLSIAQALAQAHGSEIAVESEPGQGARFSMLLRA
jgi:heavy metal sensor kinase